MLGRNVFGIADTDDAVAADATVKAIRNFFASLGLPSTLDELGVSVDEIPVMVRNLHANKGEVFGAYVPLRASDTTRIYELAAD